MEQKSDDFEGDKARQTTKAALKMINAVCLQVFVFLALVITLGYLCYRGISFLADTGMMMRCDGLRQTELFGDRYVCKLTPVEIKK